MSGLPHLGTIHFVCGSRFHPAARQNFPRKEAVTPGNYIETPFLGSWSSFCILCSTSPIWCAFRNGFISQPETNGLKTLWKGGWIIAACFRQSRQCWGKNLMHTSSDPTWMDLTKKEKCGCWPLQLGLVIVSVRVSSEESKSSQTWALSLNMLFSELRWEWVS